MPSTVKIRVEEARDLPAMDRSSKLTDAFVEVRFCGNTYETPVARKTLNPVWNHGLRVDVADDSDLQNEPIVFRVMDHDVYSADDLIGTVSIDLNPLSHRLELDVNQDDRESIEMRRRSSYDVSGQLHDKEKRKPSSLSQNPRKDGAMVQGWYPIYDTLQGIRGQLYVSVKVQFFGDENPFKESSAGVHFFIGSALDSNVLAIECLLGFVEELVVENDPEYEWSDNFRSARKSNESRQMLLYRLSNAVRRTVGKKALEMGGNAVIGYEQHFDIEGDSGLVARGFGTACIIRKSPFKRPVYGLVTPLNLPALDEKLLNWNSDVDFADKDEKDRRDSRSSKLSAPAAIVSIVDEEIQKVAPTAHESRSLSPTFRHRGYEWSPAFTSDRFVYENKERKMRRAKSTSSGLSTVVLGSRVLVSTDPLSFPEEAGKHPFYFHSYSNPGTDPRFLGNTFGENSALIHSRKRNKNSRFIRRPKGLENEVVLLTVKVLPVNVRVRLRGIVSTRSVKFLGRLAAKVADVETRDEWWAELREEIRSHARSLNCRHVLGYSESCVVYDDVCILSAIGTAAVVKDDRALWGIIGSNRTDTHLHRPRSVSASGSVAVQQSITATSATLDPSTGTFASPKFDSIRTIKEDSTGLGSQNVLKKENEMPEPIKISPLPAKQKQPREKKKYRFNFVDSAGIRRPILPCSICHVPYRNDAAPFANMRVSPCGLCRGKWVPEVLLSTTEHPPLLPVTGHGLPVEARICKIRAKTGSKSEGREADASLVSETLVFLELELHRQLIMKLKVLGMNAAFSFRSQVKRIAVRQFPVPSSIRSSLYGLETSV